jgi:hypothetical protein
VRNTRLPALAVRWRCVAVTAGREEVVVVLHALAMTAIVFVAVVCAC